MMFLRPAWPSRFRLADNAKEGTGLTTTSPGALILDTGN